VRDGRPGLGLPSARKTSRRAGDSGDRGRWEMTQSPACFIPFTVPAYIALNTPLNPNELELMVTNLLEKPQLISLILILLEHALSLLFGRPLLAPCIDFADHNSQSENSWTTCIERFRNLTLSSHASPQMTSSS
jgi:hypothetical protein